MGGGLRGVLQPSRGGSVWFLLDFWIVVGVSVAVPEAEVIRSRF